MLRAAIYARVSDPKQRKTGTIGPQLDVLKQWCAQMGFALVGVYIDDGISAKSGNLANRHDLLRMLDAATARTFDVLVVLDIDRLTRADDIIEQSLLIGTMQRAGIKIGSPSTGLLDPDTFAGAVTIGVKVAASAEWLRQHRDRINRGKLKAIAEGRKPAGPTPYGLRYSRERAAWSIHEPEAAIVREVYARVTAGESTEAIARDFTARGIPRPRGGCTWFREQPWKIATSTTYRGLWFADKRKNLTIAVPAIIDDEAWHAAQAKLLEHGKRGLRRTKHVYLLEGLAVCAACGGRIGIASAVSRFAGRNGTSGAVPARYVCSRRRRPERGAAACTLPLLQVADVDARLWAELRRSIEDGGDIEAAARTRAGDAGADREAWSRDVAAARTRLTRLADVEAAVLTRFRRGAISEAALDLELAAIGRERGMLEQQVAGGTRAQKAASARQERAQGVAPLITELRRRLAAATPALRRQLVEQVFDPGSVRLDSDGRIYATGRVRLAGLAGSSTQPETYMEIRLVA